METVKILVLYRGEISEDVFFITEYKGENIDKEIRRLLATGGEVYLQFKKEKIEPCKYPSLS